MSTQPQTPMLTALPVATDSPVVFPMRTHPSIPVATIAPTVDPTVEASSYAPVLTPVPTPDIGVLDRDVLPPPYWEASPNGLWQVMYYKWDSFELIVDENNHFYLAEMIVSYLDSSKTWTVVSEFRPMDYISEYPAPFKWSADGRSLYYTNVTGLDGCPVFDDFSNGLWELDLETGASTEIMPLNSGFFRALSPDDAWLALSDWGLDFEIINLATWESTEFPDYPQKPYGQTGGLEWSPNGQHLAILKVWEGCREDVESAVLRIDMDAMTMKLAMDLQPGQWHSLSWASLDEKATIQDSEGHTWVVDMFSGEMSKLK